MGAEVEDGQSAAQIALRALALKVRGNVKRFLPQEVMEALYSFDALARPTPSEATIILERSSVHNTFLPTRFE